MINYRDLIRTPIQLAWHQREFPYEVVFEYHWRVEEELDEWLAKYVKKENYDILVWYDDINDYHANIVWFRHRNDAIEFRLRWDGVTGE